MRKSINLQLKKARTQYSADFLFSTILSDTVMINISILSIKKFVNLKTQY